MKHIPSYLFLFLLAASLTACHQKQPATVQPVPNHDSALTIKSHHAFSVDSIPVYNCRLIADSILPAYKDLVQFYFRKYGWDTCNKLLLDSTDFRDYEGVQRIGRIHLNKPPVSVFILPRLSECALDGETYYFTDTSLPRISTESNCCHPQSLFPVGDIDEDGISEIAQYLSSCAGRYKELIVLSLKDNEWKQVGNCTMDNMSIGDVENYKPFVRKTGKGRFEMLEMEETHPGQKPEKNWLKFSF